MAAEMRAIRGPHGRRSTRRNRKGACGVLAAVRTFAGLQRDAEGADGGVGEEGN